MKLYNIIFYLTLLFPLFSCQDISITPDSPPDQSDTGNEGIYQDYAWMSEVREDHPRLFFNTETFPDVKNRALNEERGLFNEVKRRVDNLLPGIGAVNHNMGTRAAEAAFVYLVTGEDKYLDLSKQTLEDVIEYYKDRNQNQLAVNWYSYSRMHALMAYDWLFNSLSDKERTDIGARLFSEIEYMLPSTERNKFNGENSSGTEGGFYNNQSLEWYLGLVFHKTGVNDAKAREYLTAGYDSHVKVLNQRASCSGDDGGAASGTLAYCLIDYPWAEYNFFHTFISSTGLHIQNEYGYLANFVNYLYWNLLPQNREFGYGDAHHTDNSIDFPILNMHLSNLAHFFGDFYPQHAFITQWLLETKFLHGSNKAVDHPGNNEENSFPMSRFFLSNKVQSFSPLNPENLMPTARYFEKMGQIFMRSGSGNDDTYATFTTGSELTQHKHYDNNNFNIYKKGFLTLDAGTRPQPGLHLSHYYARTVAHNCITILMPGEILPNYWNSGRAPNETNSPVPNDGGQNNLLGTKLIAFDEKDEYVYVASDATNSYSSLKTEEVLRQFVFLPPNNFIVFDRVNATNATYQKKWLLHTANRPEQVSPEEFYADHEEGRLICKTIYPENSNLELVGGPGKQFWSDGKNWSLPTGGDDHPLYGQWRVEVSPIADSKDDHFLHLIQVGDRADNNRSIPSAKKIEEENMKGVQFMYQGKEYSVLFGTAGSATGKISVKSGGRDMVNENFSNTIKSQSGLELK